MQTRSALLVLACSSACGPSAVTAPDAPVSTIPTSPTGSFAVTGVLDLEVLPPPADALVAELADATDGPGDPAQFLCDRLVAALPSSWQAIGAGVAAVVAPYLESELDSVAPNFASGIRSLATGLGDLAHHMQTIETLAIEPNGEATRTITGVAYGNTSIDFASEGMSDAVAATTVSLDGDGNLQVAAHRIVLPYGRLLRLGFDRSIIPNVDLSAADLGGALRDLVDCAQLGELFAEKAGIGSPSLYETACAAGMTALAADVDDRLAAIDASPFELAASGTAVGVDDDGDGTMDAIEGGLWSGTSSYEDTAAPLVGATFAGAR